MLNALVIIITRIVIITLCSARYIYSIKKYIESVPIWDLNSLLYVDDITAVRKLSSTTYMLYKTRAV